MYLVHRHGFAVLLGRMVISAPSLYSLEGPVFPDVYRYNTQGEVALQGLLDGAKENGALTPSPALSAVLEALSGAMRPMVSFLVRDGIVPTDPGDREKLAQIVERAVRESPMPGRLTIWLTNLREVTPPPKPRKSRKKATS
jgi:hypothetical protein